MKIPLRIDCIMYKENAINDSLNYLDLIFKIKTNKLHFVAKLFCRSKWIDGVTQGYRDEDVVEQQCQP